MVCSRGQLCKRYDSFYKDCLGKQNTVSQHALDELVANCSKSLVWPPSPSMVHQVYCMVDRVCFRSLLSVSQELLGISLQFSLAVDQGPGVAGNTSYTLGGSVVLVSLNQALFEGLFVRSGSKASYLTGGRRCKNIWVCFLSTLFHEMCHVFVYFYVSVHRFTKWTQHAHGQLFSLVARKIFLQTESRHVLVPGFRALYDKKTIRLLAKQALAGLGKMYVFTGTGWSLVHIYDVRRVYATVRLLDEQEQRVVPISFLRPV